MAASEAPRLHVAPPPSSPPMSRALHSSAGAFAAVQAAAHQAAVAAAAAQAVAAVVRSTSPQLNQQPPQRLIGSGTEGAAAGAQAAAAAVLRIQRPPPINSPAPPGGGSIYFVASSPPIPLTASPSRQPLLSRARGTVNVHSSTPTLNGGSASAALVSDVLRQASSASSRAAITIQSQPVPQFFPASAEKPRTEKLRATSPPAEKHRARSPPAAGSGGTRTLRRPPDLSISPHRRPLDRAQGSPQPSHREVELLPPGGAAARGTSPPARRSTAAAAAAAGGGAGWQAPLSGTQTGYGRRGDFKANACQACDWAVGVLEVPGLQCN